MLILKLISFFIFVSSTVAYPFDMFVVEHTNGAEKHFYYLLIKENLRTWIFPQESKCTTY